MAIQITKYETKKNSYEVSAVHILNSLSGCDTLTIFKSNFENELKAVPRKSVARAASCYKLIWVGDQYLNNDAFLKLWHLDCKGYPDRLVAEIKRAK